jgi:hypothetical protein
MLEITSSFGALGVRRIVRRLVGDLCALVRAVRCVGALGVGGLCVGGVRCVCVFNGGGSARTGYADIPN